MSFAARRFESEQRKAAVARNESVALTHGSLLHKPALGRADEFEQVLYLPRLRNLLLNAGERLRGIEAGTGQQPEGVLQRFNRFRPKAAALQAHAIRTVDFAFVVASGLRERKHVLLDNRAAAHHGMLADAAELVDGAEATDVGEILHNYVPGKGDSVGQDGVVMNDNVVSYMHISHQQVVISYHRAHPAALRAAVDGYKFPDAVAVADDGLGLFAFVLFVLRGHAAGAEREKNVVAANR